MTVNAETVTDADARGNCAHEENRERETHEERLDPSSLMYGSETGEAPLSAS